MTVVVMNIHTQKTPLNHSQDRKNCVQHSHKMIYHTPEEDEENDWNDFKRLLKRVEGEVICKKVVEVIISWSKLNGPKIQQSLKITLKSST